MDWLGKLFDITKLPSKFFAWIAVLTAIFLFLPSSLSEKFRLGNFPAEYYSYAGAALIASSSFLLINLSLWIWNHTLSWFKRRLIISKIVAAIDNLDQTEQAVLREFFIQGRHVIELPLDHPTVSGLMRKHFISIAGSTGYRSLAGSVFPAMLNPTAKKILLPEHVGLSYSMNESEVDAIRRTRPNFIRRIEEHDQWRGGHFY